MARNSSDDATRRGTLGAGAVEGLLAYAYAPSRGGRAALRSAEEAVRLSRELAARDPAEYTPLLARALRETAVLLLARGRAAHALPLARESVGLARHAGGAPLATSLRCLSRICEALKEYGEAAEAMQEAVGIDRPD
jgi:tetratricopeptide (TPR) repeat protein